MWKFQAYLGVKISGLKFSGVKFFNPPNLAQFQPNLHVKILAWSHVKISGLKQVLFTCENRCDRFGTGSSSKIVKRPQRRRSSRGQWVLFCPLYSLVLIFPRTLYSDWQGDGDHIMGIVKISKKKTRSLSWSPLIVRDSFIPWTWAGIRNLWFILKAPVNYDVKIHRCKLFEFIS